MRQIRGLQGAPWKQEAAAFEEYGAAVLQLAGIYASAAEAGQPSVRYWFQRGQTLSESKNIVLRVVWRFVPASGRTLHASGAEF